MRKISRFLARVMAAVFFALAKAEAAVVKVALNVALMVALGAVALLSGCVSADTHWVKSGGGDPAADFAQCQREAINVAGAYSPGKGFARLAFGVAFDLVDNINSASAEKRLIEICMSSKGYRLEAIPHGMEAVPQPRIVRPVEDACVDADKNPVPC